MLLLDCLYKTYCPSGPRKFWMASLSASSFILSSFWRNRLRVLMRLPINSSFSNRLRFRCVGILACTNEYTVFSGKPGKMTPGYLSRRTLVIEALHKTIAPCRSSVGSVLCSSCLYSLRLCDRPALRYSGMTPYAFRTP